MRRASHCTCWLLCVASVLALAAPARAQIVEPRAVFTRSAPASTPSGEEVLRRALDNLFGFDAAIGLEIERKVAGGAPELSEFMFQRLRAREAERLLSVSVRPSKVRGNRVLQVSYDDGREETYAFVPSMGSEPVRVRYRLAEPFLATWYQIGANEPSAETRALADYELLAFEPTSTAGEPAYRLLVRSIVPRGYDRTELFVARSDFAVLEQRQYTSRSAEPVLVAQTERADLVRFGESTVPARIRYRDRVQNAEIEVRLRYSALAENSNPLFFPTTFHRAALPVLESP
jgi:hypothetical protein